MTGKGLLEIQMTGMLGPDRLFFQATEGKLEPGKLETDSWQPDSYNTAGFLATGQQARRELELWTPKVQLHMLWNYLSLPSFPEGKKGRREDERKEKRERRKKSLFLS
jgi:hypothetical protein